MNLFDTFMRYTPGCLFIHKHRRTTMKYKVEITLKITEATSGEAFAETKQTWASMSLASVVGIEKVLHAAQGELIAWSEAEVK
jgi:hypothetical protein